MHQKSLVHISTVSSRAVLNDPSGFLFVSRIQIPKPGTKGVLLMVGIGVIEVALFILYYFIFKHRVG